MAASSLALSCGSEGNGGWGRPLTDFPQMNRFSTKRDLLRVAGGVAIMDIWHAKLISAERRKGHSARRVPDQKEC